MPLGFFSGCGGNRVTQKSLKNLNERNQKDAPSIIVLCPNTNTYKNLVYFFEKLIFLNIPDFWPKLPLFLRFHQKEKKLEQ